MARRLRLEDKKPTKPKGKSPAKKKAPRKAAASTEPEFLPDEAEAPTNGLIIRVSSNWRLAWDGLQFQVQLGRVGQAGAMKGKSYWKTQSYCRSLSGAIKFCITRQIFAEKVEVGLEEANQICDFLDKIEEGTRNAIRQAIAGVPLVDIEPYDTFEGLKPSVPEKTDEEEEDEVEV